MFFRSDETSQEGLSSWVSYLSQQASAYLPQHVNELMLREKSTATARLPILGTRTVVAIPRIQVQQWRIFNKFITIFNVFFINDVMHSSSEHPPPPESIATHPKK